MTNKKSKSLLTAIILILSCVMAQGITHKFYVSICQIDMNPKTHLLEISMRLFAHDLENACQEGGIPLKLNQEADPKDNNRLIYKYLEHKLSLSSNQKSIALQVVGYELENDVIWIYLQSDKLSNDFADHPSVKIRNSVLMEVFKDQKNIINFRSDSKTTSQICTSKKPIQQFSWDPQVKKS